MMQLSSKPVQQVKRRELNNEKSNENFFLALQYYEKMRFG